jgi:hypothetical protein
MLGFFSVRKANALDLKEAKSVQISSYPIGPNYIYCCFESITQTFLSYVSSDNCLAPPATRCAAGPRVLTSSESTLFATPVGKSRSCQTETSLQLRDTDVSATVFLGAFKLQPFISKKDFGPGKMLPDSCS